MLPLFLFFHFSSLSLSLELLPVLEFLDYIHFHDIRGIVLRVDR